MSYKPSVKSENKTTKQKYKVKQTIDMNDTVCKSLHIKTTGKKRMESDKSKSLA